MVVPCVATKHSKLDVVSDAVSELWDLALMCVIRKWSSSPAVLFFVCFLDMRFMWGGLGALGFQCCFWGRCLGAFGGGSLVLGEISERQGLRTCTALKSGQQTWRSQMGSAEIPIIYGMPTCWELRMLWWWFRRGLGGLGIESVVCGGVGVGFVVHCEVSDLWELQVA